MGKRVKLYHLRANITSNSVKIRYLLESAIYKPDSARETFILGEMAIELAADIAKKSEQIGVILKHH